MGDDSLPAHLRRVLHTLADHPEATVAELHAQLGGHPNSVRNHLDGLVAQGLVVASSRSHGPGRPALRYSLTPTGLSVARDRSRVGASEGLSSLLGLLLDEYEQRQEPERDARLLGRTWAGRAGGDDGRQHETADPEAAVMSLLAQEGFAPIRRGEDIALLRCPVLAAAQAHPQVVCSIHLGMIESAYRRHGGRGEVTLQPFGAPDSCLTRLHPSPSRTENP